MLMKSSTQSLTEQLSARISERIRNRLLAPGARLPSIRHFANTHRVSKFTVVQAFDRLVAMGYLKSRQGSGFYVAQRSEAGAAANQSCRLERAMDVLWLLRNALPGGLARAEQMAGQAATVQAEQGGEAQGAKPEGQR